MKYMRIFKHLIFIFLWLNPNVSLSMDVGTRFVNFAKSCLDLLKPTYESHAEFKVALIAQVSTRLAERLNITAVILDYTKEDLQRGFLALTQLDELLSRRVLHGTNEKRKDAVLVLNSSDEAPHLTEFGGRTAIQVGAFGIRLPAKEDQDVEPWFNATYRNAIYRLIEKLP